jgi:hypothetical protein
MKRTERDKRLDGIFDRLDQIDNENREIITARPPNDTVTLSVAQLEAYGKRSDERTALHRELAVLAAEPIEED